MAGEFFLFFLLLQKEKEAKEKRARGIFCTKLQPGGTNDIYCTQKQTGRHAGRPVCEVINFYGFSNNSVGDGLCAVPLYAPRRIRTNYQISLAAVLPGPFKRNYDQSWLQL